MLETDLYPPVRTFLEGLGYDVKGEVGSCDIVAVRGDEPPVIVELKVRLNLELILQGIRRQTLSDAVYIAVPDDRRKKSRTLLHRSYRDVLRLVKLLGLGLIVVRFRAKGTTVEAVVDPAPYQPRKSLRKRRRLLSEFAQLRADYNVGGSRGARMTAYRQDALACARYLQVHGTSRPVAIRDATGVARAGRIVYTNHYGWFERLGAGEYAISESGLAALQQYRDVVAALEPDAET